MQRELTATELHALHRAAEREMLIAWGFDRDRPIHRELVLDTKTGECGVRWTQDDA